MKNYNETNPYPEGLGPSDKTVDAALKKIEIDTHDSELLAISEYASKIPDSALPKMTQKVKNFKIKTKSSYESNCLDLLELSISYLPTDIVANRGFYALPEGKEKLIKELEQVIGNEKTYPYSWMPENVTEPQKIHLHFLVEKLKSLP